jgi:hypothetical protein
LLELLFWTAIFVAAFATATTRADGSANAPGEELFFRWTGGTLCLFRRVTGIPCPGCGLSHGFVHLAHGDFLAAIADNPLTPVVFFLAALRFATVAIAVLGRREVSFRVSRRAFWLMFAAFALSGFALGAWRVYEHSVHA